MAAPQPQPQQQPIAPSLRVLTACYDDEGIYCYQAYKPAIGEAAARRGRFEGIAGFSPTRMTWIKFSLGWMMYRCDYARSHNQEVVLRIKLSWAALQRILSEAVGSTWAPRLHPTKAEWTGAMANSSVRFQWDPERNLRIEKLGSGQRALQLGLAKDVAAQFACDPQWILSIEDCTAQVRAIKAAIDAGEPLPAVPLEREYVIEDAALRKSLAMDLSHADEDHGPPAPVRKAKGQRNGQAGHGAAVQAQPAASADAAADADMGGPASSSSASSS